MLSQKYLQRPAGLLIFLMLATAAPLDLQAAEPSAGHRLTIRIPPVLRLEVDPGELVFDLNQPRKGEVETERVTVRVFANRRETWQLSLKGEEEGFSLPAQVEWSSNGTDWTPLSNRPEMLVSGGYTGGWREIKVYYRLRLAGGEDKAEAAEYRIKVHYDLSIL